MMVRIQKPPLASPWERALRLQGFAAIALGVGILVVWNPLARPGPTMCLLRHAVGLPCPLCGMTRGVALSLRGQPIDATLFNPLSVPVLLLALLLAVKWAFEFVTGRRFEVLAPPRVGRGFVFVVYGLLLANWTYMVIYRREDPFAASWLGQLWTRITGGG